MKYLFYFFSLIAFNYSIAQQIKRDVFPLNLNNSWVYNYQYNYECFNNFGEGSSGSDSGLVIYTIIDSEKISDSVKWTIQTIQYLQVHYYEKQYVETFDTTYNFLDTTYFELWEKLDGDHQIFVDNPYYYGNPIWKFSYIYPDSQKIFRYKFTNSLHQITFTSNSAIGYFSSRQLPIDITFEEDSGVVDLSLFEVGICGGHSSIKIQCNLLSSIITSVNKAELKTTLPSIKLNQNYPNPFNPITTINYYIPTESYVTLFVYDNLGEKVTTLISEYKMPGNHIISFDATILASGIYFYQLITNGSMISKKMILLR